VRLPSSLKDGLVAYYPFDGNADDNSGNGNHGTPQGNAQLTTDRFGVPFGAYLFASPSCIKIINGIPFQFTQSNFTISLWVNPAVDPGSSWPPLIAKSHVLPVAAEWSLEMATEVNKITLAVYDSGISDWRGTPVIQLTANTWSHVLVMRTGKRLSLWVNNNAGGPPSSGLMTSSKLVPNGNLPVSIGCVEATPSNRYFNGLIDDVFIFNRSLSTEERKQLYNFDTPTSQPSRQPSSQPSRQPTSRPTVRILPASLKDGLVAFFPFDGNADDNSGNENHGSLLGTPQRASDRFGNSGNAYSFGGLSSPACIKIDNGRPFQFTQANFTISMWVKPSASQGGPSTTLIEKSHNTPANAEWSLEMFATVNVYSFYAYDSSWHNTEGVTLTADTWNHIVAMKRGKKLYTYYNGLNTPVVATLTSFTLTGNGNAPVYIGCHQGDGLYFNGAIDDVFVFNRSLSTTEIKQLYSFDTPTSQPSRQPTSQPTVRILPASLKDGLVAFYPFDGNADDNSGNGNHGILQGTQFPVPATDRFGNPSSAYSFSSATSSCVKIPNGSPFQFIQANFTISLWANPGSTQGPGSTLIEKSHDLPNPCEWAVEMSGVTNKYTFTIWDVSNWNPTQSIQFNVNSWNHFLLMKTGKKTFAYLNGVLLGTATLSTSRLSSNGNLPVYIGCFLGGDRYFNGLIDDVFVFNRSLSSEERKQLYNFDSPTSQPSRQPTSQPTVRTFPLSLKGGLVAFYPFDGNADDNSGNGNHGILQGNVRLTKDRFGVATKAYSFDGTTSFIQINNGNPFQFPNNNFTVSFWVKPSAFQLHDATIFDKSHDICSCEWSVEQLENVKNKYYLIARDFTLNQWTNSAEAVQFITNDWNHFVLVKQGKSYYSYLNGNLVVTSQATSTRIISNGNQPLYIGANGGINRFFNGSIDDIFVFNRSITKTEISQLYGVSSPTSQPSAQPTTPILHSSVNEGLLAYYPFNGDADDYSGNANHGDTQNVQSGPDRFGNPDKSLSFTSTSSSCVTISNGRPFQFVASNFSISLWVKPSSSQSGGSTPLIEKSHETPGYSEWSVEMTNTANEFAFVVYDSVIPGWVYTPGLQMIANSWNHFVVVRNGKRLSAFLNGGPPSTVTLQTSKLVANGNQPVHIGCFPGSNKYFSGSIDDILIFNRTLTVDEIRHLHEFDAPTSQPSSQPTSLMVPSTLKDGLVAYYPFDGNTFDKSGNRNDGTVRGGNGLVEDRFGKANSAWSFNGINRCIEVANGGSFNFNNNMSVSLWVKAASQTGWIRLLDKGYLYTAVPSGGWTLIQNLDINKYGFTYVNTLQVVFGTNSFQFPSGEWTHVVASKQDRTVSIYVNGALRFAQTFANAMINSTGNMPLMIGCQNYGNTNPATNLQMWFSGQMDEIFIYNRPLTAAEVMKLYQFDAPTSQPSRQPSSQPSQQPTQQPSRLFSYSGGNGLIAYYSFNGNANDQTGNGNNGVVHSATLTNDRFGLPNSAYYFDGTSSYIQFPGEQFNFNRDLTIAFWIKPAASQIAWVNLFQKLVNFDVGGWVLEQGNTATNAFRFTYVFGLANPNRQTATSPTVQAVANVWNHLVYTKYANAFTVYLNGTQVGQDVGMAVPVVSNSNAPMYIGSDGHLHATMDDVLFYNRSLTGLEIRSLFKEQQLPLTSKPSSQPTQQPSSQPTVRISSSLKDGLAGYYPFEGNANDKSGNSNNGQIIGALPVADRFGNPNSAYRFTGSNSYIQINNGQSFDFADSFSIAFWLNPGSSQLQSATIASKSCNTFTGNGRSWAVQQLATFLNAYRLMYKAVSNAACDSGGWCGSASPSIVANKWTFWTVTKDINTMMVYVNGILTDTTGNRPVVKRNDNLPLYFGCDISSGTPVKCFNGTLDDIFIYNRTLTVDEIRKLYQFDIPTSQPSTHPTNQPTSQPTAQPSTQPTTQPTSQPTRQPIALPSNQPSSRPSSQPTIQPSRQPTRQPVSPPSAQPTTQPTVRISSSSLRNGLVAYYPFDGDANDNGGRGNHGAVKGGVLFTEDRFGNPGGAVSFNGGNSYIEIPGKDFNFVNNMSISFWMNVGVDQRSVVCHLFR
jgi:hypothetical protein